MISRMKHLMRILCCLAVLLAAPTVASARESFEEPEMYDARLEGYERNVNINPPGTTALTWLLLVFLATVGVGVMFKDAKRTHLD